MGNASSWLPRDIPFDPTYPYTSWGRVSGGKRSSTRTGAKATRKDHNRTRPRIDGYGVSRAKVVSPPLLDDLVEKNNGDLLKSIGQYMAWEPPKTPCRSLFFQMECEREGAEEAANREKMHQDFLRNQAEAEAIPLPPSRRYIRVTVDCKCGHSETLSAYVPPDRDDKVVEYLHIMRAFKRDCVECQDKAFKQTRPRPVDEEYGVGD